jgi:multidrug efflux system outer membrane protein
MTTRPFIQAILTGIVTLLSGCLAVGPDYDRSQATTVTNQPEQWQATLPHAGKSESLENWWAQFNDPLLITLIHAAQLESSSLAAATLKIAQARALNTATLSASLPTLAAAASETRGTTNLGGPIVTGTTVQAQAQASWEIDLFGGVQRRRESSLARLDAEVANWHAARISVAAEMANIYTNFRSCEQQVALYEVDVQSREQTASLSEKLGQAGFQSSANVALSRASAAEGLARLVTQRAECDIAIKSMVALTGLKESELRQQLHAQQAILPLAQQLQVSTVPAQVLAQRPDVAAAERELAAASADIGVRIADRFPKMMLLGNIGPLNFSAGNISIDATSWSFGPTLSLPIFDSGKLAANVETARVAYQAAQTNYRQRVRTAIREVEEALVRLDSMAQREQQATIASDGFHQSLEAAQARWKNGLASQLELEETRRLSFNADQTLTLIKRERVNAWVALYRAVGGGWQPVDMQASLARQTPQ